MLKMEGYFRVRHIPVVKSIVDYLNKTIEMRKTLDGEENKVGIVIISFRIASNSCLRNQ